MVQPAPSRWSRRLNSSPNTAGPPKLSISPAKSPRATPPCPPTKNAATEPGCAKQRRWSAACGKRSDSPDQLDQFFGETALRFARDERSNARGGGGADFAPAMALVPRAFHRVIERVFRRRRGDVAGGAVVDDLRVAAGIGDDRHAAGQHRFDQHDRQSFAARRQDQAVVSAPDRGDIVDEAGECHVGEAEVAGHALETGALLTVAVERDRQRTIAPSLARQNAQQKVLSFFLWMQTSDAGQPPFAIVRPVRARFPRNEKGVAHHLRARQRESELF